MIKLSKTKAYSDACKFLAIMTVVVNLMFTVGFIHAVIAADWQEGAALAALWFVGGVVFRFFFKRGWPKMYAQGMQELAMKAQTNA